MQTNETNQQNGIKPTGKATHKCLKDVTVSYKVGKDFTGAIQVAVRFKDGSRTAMQLAQFLDTFSVA